MKNASQEIITQVLSIIKFNDSGLVPAIAQQHNTGEVLMMAWMNDLAISETLKVGKVCYWSRSRKKLWRKGEISGQTQALMEFRWDCDNDTILLLVEQTGVACHTGRKNCFFNAIRSNQIIETTEIKIDPKKLYN